MGFLRLILETLGGFLPARYRRWSSDPVRGCLYSGILEAVIALVVYLRAYFRFVQSWGVMAAGAMSSEAAAGRGAEQLGMALGAVGYVSFAVSPVALLALFSMVEGVLRAVSAGIIHEAAAALPFWAVGAIHGAVERRVALLRLPPPEPDSVVLGRPGDGFDLRITSGREKEGWRPPVQIEYAGVVYDIVIVGHEQAVGRTRFVYTLRRGGAIGAFRGIIHYDPFEYWKSGGGQ